MGDLKLAVTCHKKSLVIAQNDDDEAGLAREYDSVGCVYGLMGEHSKALESFQRELAVFQKCKDVYTDVAEEMARVNGAAQRPKPFTQHGPPRTPKHTLARKSGLVHPSAGLNGS